MKKAEDRPVADSQGVTAGRLVIRQLSSQDTAHLAPLLNAYRAEMYPASETENLRQDAATALLSSQTAEVIGGFLDGKLSAFAVFFDLPEAISNGRAGQLDDLYVAAGARGQRLAQEMVQAVALIGRARGWVHLRWLVPEDNAAALRTYERFAKAALEKLRVVVGRWRLLVRQSILNLLVTRFAGIHLIGAVRFHPC